MEVMSYTITPFNSVFIIPKINFEDPQKESEGRAAGNQSGDTPVLTCIISLHPNDVNWNAALYFQCSLKSASNHVMIQQNHHKEAEGKLVKALDPLFHCYSTLQMFLQETCKSYNCKQFALRSPVKIESKSVRFIAQCFGYIMRTTLFVYMYIFLAFSPS